MRKQLNIGIIGYGFMGQTHADTIAQLDYAQLLAVCDIDPDRFKELPQQIKAFTEADALLAEPAIDTVIIAVPNQLHLEMVLKAARAKKDIICEKPLAMNAKAVSYTHLTLPTN